MRSLICFRYCQNFYVSRWKKEKFLKEKLHQEKNLSFHIILQYRALPETSLRSFIKTSTAVAGSESRLQTNQLFCPCSITQKVQSSKRCLHGIYSWGFGNLALFTLLMRLLLVRSWEWPFSHGLQSGSQQQDPQVAIETLEGQNIPGPSATQETRAWNKGPQSQGRVSMSKRLTTASTGRLQ